MISAYRRMQLPVPHDTWDLCTVTYGQTVFLAFADPAASADKMEFLIGQDTIRNTMFWRFRKWNHAAHDRVEDVAPSSFGSNPFDSNNALATAIQCRIRGMTNEASRLFILSQSIDVGTPGGVFYTRRNSDPMEATYRMGWSYWGDRLLDKDTRRSIALSNMQYIVSACQPMQGKDKLRLLHRLALTVNWEKALIRGDSVIGPVDRLLDVSYPTTNDPAFRVSFDFREAPEVQALISSTQTNIDDELRRYVSDERLTRAHSHGIMKMEARYLTIGDMVAYILDKRHDPIGRTK